MSAYKIETWLKKGFSEEEAKYQIKIRRPNNKEFYIHKFNVSEDEAIRMVVEYQKNSGKMAASRPIEEIKKSSPRCVEYWVEKGFSYKEASEKVSEIQSTFSKDKCIDKHGTTIGLEVWKMRQIKWQNTLSNKNKEEKENINKQKNPLNIQTYIKKYGEISGKEYYLNNLIIRNCKIFKSLDELETYILDSMDDFDYYLPLNKFKQKFIKNYYFELFDIPKNIDDWLIGFINFKSTNGKIIFKTNKTKYGNQNYKMWVGDKLLRSSNEILFYQLLVEYNLEEGVDFIIEKNYPDSKMRCDFYLNKANIWIELSGFLDEEYKQKMLYKKDTFSAIILDNKKEYKNYINDYVKQNYEN